MRFTYRDLKAAVEHRGRQRFQVELHHTKVNSDYHLFGLLSFVDSAISLKKESTYLVNVRVWDASHRPKGA